MERILIRNNSTGEVREFADEFATEDSVYYQWFYGGNYSCDCNRALFFARAKSEEEPDVPCGHEAYSAKLADDVDWRGYDW
jgi:hypothetical protein